MLRAHGHHHEEGAEVATDPVCGMSVDIATAEHRSSQKDRTYYFCSAGCKKTFDQDPARFISSAKTSQ